jgi:hypothetical protein
VTKKSTLSKSRFKLAVECPTKVYYSLDRRYLNTKDEDEFLQALADGGFQVGELAKRMYRADDPSAVEVTVRDEQAQVRETEALLQRENVTIFEGTIRHGNLLARVDVLRKRGNVVELIEVKSKSFDPNREDHSFRGKRGGIRSTWLPYLQDVAFQAYVLRAVHPELEVRPFLLLVDPTVPCSVEGLGAAIRVERDANNRPQVAVDAAFDVMRLRPALLKAHDVSEYVHEILEGPVETPEGMFGFDEYVVRMAAAIVADRKIDPPVGAQCKKCEFYCAPDERNDDVRSGWAECMEARFPGKGDVPRSATVFALYNHRKADEFLVHGKLLLTEVDGDDVGHDESAGEIAPAHRHRLQIEEARNGRNTRLIRERTLRRAFESWRFPLHFIDFETSRPTLPFTVGRRPNQQLLFQFSHHVMDEKGRVEHRTQSLVAEPGVVPSAAVVRALRDALGSDDGTVLHWWDHERNVLNDVRAQLEAGDELDRGKLVEFIGTLVGTDDRPGRLTDMGRPLVARTAFLAGTDGRSSIKKVLQAMLAQSEYLRERYSQPVYGTREMPSLNFPAGWAWWREQGGMVRDPYTLLGQLLADPELDRLAREEEEDEASLFVANGGAAMVAYGQLQQPALPAEERRRLEGQLLRYCELDTLAMVMVYEALREWVG